MDPSTLIIAGLIVVAAITAMIGVKRSVSSLKKKLPKTDVGKLVKWVHVGILVVAAVIILQLFEFPMMVVIGVLGSLFGVLLLGLISTWSTLCNFPCTLYLVATKPFSVGDDLEIPGDNIKGRVIDITLAFTVLEDTDGFQVNIPNAHFLYKQFRHRAGNVSISLAKQLRKHDPATGLDTSKPASTATSTGGPAKAATSAPAKPVTAKPTAPAKPVVQAARPEVKAVTATPKAVAPKPAPEGSKKFRVT